MKTKVRYLTKSRFKIGTECARKLNYNDDPAYGNTKESDQFLKALAEGGFQVGELAKLYHPGGVDLSEVKGHAEAVEKTKVELEKTDAIIYEAALQFEHCFIRVDVLVKTGRTLRLIEVKAKSFDGGPIEVFNSRSLEKGEYVLGAKWGSYYLDIAFQTWVARQAMPGFSIEPYLMLADTSRVATVDGIHQHFFISRGDDGASRVTVKEGTSRDQIGDELLTRVGVRDEVEHILNDVRFEGYEGFEDMVASFSAVIRENRRAQAKPGSQCRNCEFRIRSAPDGKKSGYEECWKESRGLKDSDFERQFVYDIWDMRSSDRLMDQEGVIFASDLDRKDLEGKSKSKKSAQLGHTRVDRQEFQIELEGRSGELAGDVSQLASEIASFRYPLHFIDFETAMVAIPFFRGHRPYSQHAYQFSHHVLHADGRHEHRTEYLDARVGHFPNFDFVRALQKALDGDDGTVFRFAAHENTVLNQIREQLLESSETDRESLVSWIESITTPSGKNLNEWTPSRQFVDMLDIYKRHTYLADTRGSNSIKKVLPAILSRAGHELSTRFPEWIQFDEAGKPYDPYKLLPPTWGLEIAAEEVAKYQERLIRDDNLNQGGAALIAWARMQFTEMSNDEREKLSDALKRYCKLDTLAMVIVWEWWQLEISRAGTRAA